MQSVLDCFCPRRDVISDDRSASGLRGQGAYTSENMFYYHDEPVTYTLSEAAAKIVTAIFEANVVGMDLQHALEHMVRETGWSDQAIAHAVLVALKKALEAGKVMDPALRCAYGKALEEAMQMEEFAKEDLLLSDGFGTVVALGTLRLLWPHIIDALGFTLIGPLEGMFQYGTLGEAELTIYVDSFPAAWQSLYGGRVPYGSVLCYLQRLAMISK